MQYRSLGMMGYVGEVGASAAYALYLFLLFPTSSQVATSQTDPVSIATPASVAVGMLGASAGILVALTWFCAGREKRSGLFMATGVVEFLTSVLSYALTLWSLYLFSHPNPLATNQQLLGPILSILGFGLTIGVLGLTFVILEIVSFFSAAREFQSKYFRWAGYGRILAIVGGIIVLVGVGFLWMEALFTSAAIGGGAPSPQIIAGFTKYFLWGGAVFVLIWAIPDVFAFFGFRGIPKGQAPPLLAEGIAVGSSPTS